MSRAKAERPGFSAGIPQGNLDGVEGMHHTVDGSGIVGVDMRFIAVQHQAIIRQKPRMPSPDRLSQFFRETQIEVVLTMKSSGVMCRALA